MSAPRHRTRVTTATLALFNDDRALFDEFAPAVRRFVAKHPADVLVLETGDAQRSDHSVERWSHLTIAQRSPEAAVSLLREHTRHGIPLVLLWISARPVDDAHFTALAEAARAIVFDSARVPQCSRALPAVRLQAAALADRGLHDLAFLRIAPWQEAVAHLFDEPRHAAALQHPREMRIVSGSLADACYLAGWVCAQVGWQPDSATSARTASGDAVRITMERHESAASVRSFTLHGTACTVGASVHGHDARSVALCFDEAGTIVERHIAFRAPPTEAMIEHAVLAPRATPVFPRTVEAAAMLARHLDTAPS
jgi:glucose-6-phosphate dehydrogenase assembly protein OpcA